MPGNAPFRPDQPLLLQPGPLLTFGAFMKPASLATYLLLTKARNALERDINTQLTSANLTATQFAVIDMVQSGHARTAVQCGRLLEMSTPSVGRVLDVLERKGLVIRERGVVDRRVVLITLSDEGHAAHRQAQTILGALGPARFAGLAQLLEHWHSAPQP
jgi:DNA-binding MarR family transcriptional regulator